MNPQSIDLDRFWNKIEKVKSGCWEWTAALHTSGYGIFGVKNNRVDRAHRIMWLLKYGEIPPGLFVCHKCDNRKCVNPKHLFLGTNRDNFNDMVAKGRYSPPPPMGGWNRISVPKKAKKMFGKKADTIIGRAFGLSKSVIARARRELGIKALESQTRFKKGMPHPRWNRKKGVI